MQERVSFLLSFCIARTSGSVDTDACPYLVGADIAAHLDSMTEGDSSAHIICPAQADSTASMWAKMPADWSHAPFATKRAANQSECTPENLAPSKRPNAGVGAGFDEEHGLKNSSHATAIST